MVIRSSLQLILVTLLSWALTSSGTAHAAGLMHKSALDLFQDDDELFLAIYDHIAGTTTGFNANGELEIAKAVLDASIEWGLDPFLVLSVIQIESSFIKGQVSSAGAMGLMQVKPSTGAAFATMSGVSWDGPATLFDINSNIRIGVGYLAFKLSRFEGDIEVALAAYCHGPTRIRSLLRKNNGSLDEAHSGYSARVLKVYNAYRGDLGLPVG